MILKPTYIRGFYSTRVTHLRIDCAYIMIMTHSSGNRVIFLRRIMTGGGVIILCRLITAVIILQGYLICFTPGLLSTVPSSQQRAERISFSFNLSLFFFSADDKIFSMKFVYQCITDQIFLLFRQQTDPVLFSFFEKSKHFS